MFFFITLLPSILKLDQESVLHAANVMREVAGTLAIVAAILILLTRRYK